MPTLEQLIALGFDDSRQAEDESGTLQVRCHNCTATVVNGTPIHERGCPNEMVECNGCSNLLRASTARFRPYCADCS